MKPVNYDAYAIVIYGILSCDASSMLNLMLSKGISIKDVDLKDTVSVTVEIPDDILANKIDDINKEFESANLESVRKCSITKISGNKGRIAVITVPSEVYLAVMSNHETIDDYRINDIVKNSGPYVKRIIADIYNKGMAVKLRNFINVKTPMFEIAIESDDISEEWCENANIEISMSFYKCIRESKVKLCDNGKFYNVVIPVSLANKIADYDGENDMNILCR